MSQVMAFPIGGSVNANILPLFIFSDGETRYTATEIPPHYRPNYLVRYSGMGVSPSAFANLEGMGGIKIQPQPPGGPLNLANPATWYPDYGREGEGFDVISPNYTKNLWSAASGGGGLPPISVPAGNEWIAFQFFSTNFPEDGVDGDGESSYVMAGGIFSDEDYYSYSQPYYYSQSYYYSQPYYYSQTGYYSYSQPYYYSLPYYYTQTAYPIYREIPPL